jgi:hypothetical protein
VEGELDPSILRGERQNGQGGFVSRLGFRIPGTPTIPESIAAERGPYYRASQAADTAWADGRIDLSEMEALMTGLLAKQLLAVHRQATGNPDRL